MKTSVPTEPDWLSTDLAIWHDRGLQRRPVAMSRPEPGRIQVTRDDGSTLLAWDFASNDYLGLAADPRIQKRVSDFVLAEGWGAAAAPLVTGYHPEHALLEAELARFARVEAVLLFGSGFAANVGILSAIAGPEDIVFCEKRNHASLVDGCRLSGAKLQVFRSTQLDRLKERLARSSRYRRRFIVTDSVFSMDGDVAPLADLCDLADQFDALLYVDEAHAIGLLGPTGRGIAEAQGVEHRIPLRLGTLGKAFGSAGGFVMTTARWRDWLRHQARSFVYSTSLPAACAVAGRTALSIIESEPQRREQALSAAGQLRTTLVEAGFTVGDPSLPASSSAIVPILVGEPDRTIALAVRLQKEGFWTVAIRPPTVAAGTSRLRVTTGSAVYGETSERFAFALKGCQDSVSQAK